VTSNQDTAMTEDWVVEGWYGTLYGWEALTYCETRAEAVEHAALYDRNEPGYRHRVRRES
jgi:hypothetical protein